MARPQQNNADYFSHDNNMRNHRKVKILRNKFGSQTGYAFWCIILEYLTGMDGTEFEYCDMEFEMIASELGGVSAAEIKNMVDFALNAELLFKSDDNFIYSESLNDRLSPLFKKRHQEREKSRARLRRMDGRYKPVNGSKIEEKTTSGGVSAAEMPQSKVKESKEEVSKDTITYVGLDKPTTTVLSFEEKCKNYILSFNEIRKSKYQVTDDIRKKLKVRLKNYNKAQIVKALKEAMQDKHHIENSFKYLTPAYLLREEILERYLNTTNQIIANQAFGGFKGVNHDDRD